MWQTHAFERFEQSYVQTLSISSSFAKQFSSILSRLSTMFPHLHTSLAHLCSGPACTAARHWPWPGSATVPSTSFALVWSVSKVTLWCSQSAVLTLSSCFKARLCLCRVRRWRLKSTSVHSPGKEKKKTTKGARATSLNHLLHCGSTNAVWEAIGERRRPPRQSIYPRCPWIKPPKLLKLQ